MGSPVLSPLELAQLTADPGSPNNGDTWLRSDVKELRTRIGGVTYVMGTELLPLPLGFGGTLYVRAGPSRIYLPFACEWAYTEAGVNTQPTGAAIILDINKNGTTIHTTQTRRPTIAVSTNRATITAAPDVTTFAAGDYLSVDVDQVGSTVAGADLAVTVFLRRTA